MMRTTHGTGSQRESSGCTGGAPVRLAMVAVVAVTIAMPSLSAAQAPPETPAAAFDELPLLLKLGDRITVTDDTGRELQGGTHRPLPVGALGAGGRARRLAGNRQCWEDEVPERLAVHRTYALRLAGNRDYWDHAAASGLAQGRGTVGVHVGRSRWIDIGGNWGGRIRPGLYAGRCHILWRPRDKRRHGHGCCARRLARRLRHAGLLAARLRRAADLPRPHGRCRVAGFLTATLRGQPAPENHAGFA